MYKLRLFRMLMYMEVKSRPKIAGSHLLFPLLQPMAMLSAITLFFNLAGQQIGYGGNIFTFLVTGLLPHFAATHTEVRVSKAQVGWRQNKKIPGSSVTDFIIAAGALETLLFLFSTLVLLYGFFLFNNEFGLPDDSIKIVAAFLLLGIIGTGVGAINLALTRILPLWELIYMPFQRFLFFLSGAFYVVDYIPVMLRDVVVYNPIAHCGMMVRIGFYGEQYPHMTLNMNYVFWFALGSLFIGLFLERITRNIVTKKNDREETAVDAGW